MKIVMAIFYECSDEARVFVPRKAFQFWLLFSSKVKAYPHGTPYGKLLDRMIAFYGHNSLMCNNKVEWLSLAWLSSLG
jgi:hypothetical protein